MTLPAEIHSVSTSHLNRSVLDRESARASLSGVPLGEQLQESLALSEQELYRELADYFALEFIADPETVLSTTLLRELPTELFTDGRCLPISLTDDEFRIAIADPVDLDIVFRAQALTGVPVTCTLISHQSLSRFHKHFFNKDSLFKQSAGKIAREYEKHLQIDDDLSLEEIRQRMESEPVVKMATLIFDEAIKLGASDIHIEPSEQKATVRFRIDGLLRQHTELTKWMFSPLTSRIKILADLDIAEKRSPQDGRIRYVFDGQAFDFRVSTLPTHFGEKTVIRILKHDHSLLDLKMVGLSETNREILSDLIEKPQGMIFVTGPTGSGKSSTLFACLNIIRSKEINITTIENPIEYKLDGVNQVQINEKAGVTFASALRSILRQDPDVILVGEIRDTETAQIAVQSAQTGHLVFSTLHTNDAVSAITRLRDLGVPPFMIASSVLAILAQRLVRVLCDDCRKEVKINDTMKKRLRNFIGMQSISRAFEPVGCPKCNHTGYRGRTGIFELVTISEKLRDSIADNGSEAAIRKILREEGFRSLIVDGIIKVEQGITSPEELLRIVQIDETHE
ncbi:MAG: type II/IV secretion system protein [Chitinispirillaceae bacterium]|nr:type II/IV secretion system protein [Chitinispirillaceae bacterium]